MKIFSVLKLALFTGVVFANTQAETELQKRLSLVSQYKADFSQIVRSVKGNIIQEGEGTFQVKRPNLFKMDVKTPQENEIISDGKNLWFYDPFVSQVTVNWLENVVTDTPFVLLTNNEPKNWKQYDVTQEMDNFVLKPLSKHSGIEQFDIRITKNGVLKGFSTIEKTGQSNLYLLKNISNQVDKDVFKFTVPEGAEIDDQRIKK
ncbi:outer-membrane lipoprotein carrier protein LolA [Phocoenobacter uteri]|nr:outer membrane lipoprotein chaperone LolA [Phocoenobacter uteri]MDG6882680.1 outer-membrane lipoprotein carrier protein LolA [Phocoenobacter uteri]